MQDDELVSCLMVTLATPQRLAFAKRSIDAFCSQTHEARELVIVIDGGRGESQAAITDYVSSLGRTDVVIVAGPSGLTLGALRNLSRSQAKGSFHCQWDDDDIHHPERIARQLAALAEPGAVAVGMEDIWQFFPATRELYWINWKATPVTVFPGAIMMRADAQVEYPEAGETAQRGEDKAVCDHLRDEGGLRSLSGAPHLLVYFSHGANTWGDGHHAMLARDLGLSAGLLRRREAWIREHLAEIDLGPDPVTVRGPNGAAFTVDCQDRL